MQQTRKGLLDVHHRVGVLAGVGLGATAWAGSNGHAMLPAGHVAPHRDVQGWVGIKEPEWLQVEAHMLSRHDRPILNSRDVRHPKRMPDDTVCFHQVSILHAGSSIRHETCKEHGLHSWQGRDQALQNMSHWLPNKSCKSV